MKAPEVRIKRMDAGVNQGPLANELGWNRETIVDIERGRVGIDQETYTEIEEAINRLRKAAPECKETMSGSGAG